MRGRDANVVRPVRCAVYTRKSTEEGLEQEFNTLDAQREACEAYILSQKSEGWTKVADNYDDGGYSGGNLERPALKRLLRDIEAGKVDVVVVYKVDRLTRSLMDFSKLVDAFNAGDVTFVSVTQHFNTTTSMGRLTLNMLLSFAQYEREIIGERIRDKIAASRRRGIWMGGMPPLGYNVRDRKLVINPQEATIVRFIFERFAQMGSLVQLIRDLKTKGYQTKSWTTAKGRVRQGHDFDVVVLHKMLRNRVYLGEAVHRGTAYPGEHDAIISQEAWEKVQAVIATNSHARGNQSRSSTPFLLKGLIFVKETGRAMVPTYTRRPGGKMYRYYIPIEALKKLPEDCPVHRIPAGELEETVVAQMRRLIQTPELIAQTWLTTRAEDPSISETEIRDALAQFDAVWKELFPAEQARITQLLVERVDVLPDGIEVRMRLTGLRTLVGELKTPKARLSAEEAA